MHPSIAHEMSYKLELSEPAVNVSTNEPYKILRQTRPGISYAEMATKSANRTARINNIAV